MMKQSIILKVVDLTDVEVAAVQVISVRSNCRFSSHFENELIFKDAFQMYAIGVMKVEVEVVARTVVEVVNQLPKMVNKTCSFFNLNPTCILN